MDTLVSVGTLAAYFYSLWAMLSGAHLYFESAATITTLILIGRFMEEKTKNRASKAMEKLTDLYPSKDNFVRKTVKYVAEVLLGEASRITTFWADELTDEGIKERDIVGTELSESLEEYKAEKTNDELPCERMNVEISEHEYCQLEKLTDKLYKGNRGANCPSLFTKALRLLSEFEALKQNKEGRENGQPVTIIQGETPICDYCTNYLKCGGHVSNCKGFTLSKEKDDEIFKQKLKLNAIKRLAETLVHKDRTCSLEAQGFSQLECAEIATEDSIASKLLGIIKGVGELKKDIVEANDKQQKVTKKE